MLLLQPAAAHYMKPFGCRWGLTYVKRKEKKGTEAFWLTESSFLSEFSVSKYCSGCVLYTINTRTFIRLTQLAPQRYFHFSIGLDWTNAPTACVLLGSDGPAKQQSKSVYFSPSSLIPSSWHEVLAKKYCTGDWALQSQWRTLMHKNKIYY